MAAIPNPFPSEPQSITVFPDFISTHQPYYVTFANVVERIRTGSSPKTKSLIDALRAETDEAKKTALKLKLPCICFSGRFINRSDKALKTHSGLIVLDYDHAPAKYRAMSKGDVSDLLTMYDGIELTEHPEKKGTYALSISSPAEFRDSLKSCPWIACAFISPSGTGVKAVVRIPANAKNHRGHYTAILKRFPVLDPTSRNESRICYDSYDPGIWVSEEFVEFAEYVVPPEEITPVKPANGTRATKTDYSKLNLCVAMIRGSSDGEKHEVLLKAAKLAGGYIAGGLFDENAAIQALESEIQAKPGVVNVQGAFKTIRDGIEYGKRVPIYEQQPEQQPLPKTETRNGVVYLADVWETMDHSFHHGKKRGETTGFPWLDQHFTFKPGEVTVGSGRPNSGKSEWFMQLMLIKAVTCGWKWAVFSPESYPADEFFDTLIHALVGKTTDPLFATWQMSTAEYEEAASFIHDHFFFVYPDTAHTIEEVEANFLHLHQKHGLAGVLIDPFNQLTRDFGMRDDQYLEQFVTGRQRMAREHQLVYLIVVHPKQMQKNKDGEYDMVDAYDLANGAMWINKVDNFISVYRPHQNRNPKDTTVIVASKKIKRQKLVGIPGEVTLTFDRRTNRYYDGDYTPLSGNPAPPIASTQFPVNS